MSTVIRNSRRIFTGGDTALNTRIGILENSKLKITYFEEINTNSGTITIPTGATILLDQFQSGADAYVSTIQNSQPTGIFPKTSLGVTVDVASFDALGNFVLSGTPSAYPVALIYILKISLKDYYNLNIDHILDEDEVSNIDYSQIGIGDSSNRLSGSDQFKLIYDGFGRPNLYLLDKFANGITMGTTGTLSSVQSVGNIDLLLQAKISSYINLGYQTNITYHSDGGIHLFGENIQTNGQSISVIDNIAGSTVFLRADNTSSNGAAGIQLSSGAGGTLAGFNTYTVGGNYAGTSLPITGTALIDSQSGAHPLVLMASEHINLVGNISTNYGTILDLNGFRIDLLSALNTSNIYPFQVVGTANSFNILSDGSFSLKDHGTYSIDARVTGTVGYITSSNFELISTNYTNIASGGPVLLGGGSNNSIRIDAIGFNLDLTTANYSYTNVYPFQITTAGGIALRINNSSKISMYSLPTTNAGLSTGDLYISTAATILANGDKVVGIKV